MDAEVPGDTKRNYSVSIDERFETSVDRFGKGDMVFSPPACDRHFQWVTQGACGGRGGRVPAVKRILGTTG
jgi:hypothetical protein